MKKSILNWIAAWLCAASLHAIEGIYDVKGYDPYEKKPYTGTIEITKDDNDVYQAKWVLDVAPSNYIGTGLKIKDQVSFIYQSIPEKIGGEVGLQIYMIEKDKLEGPFVYYKGALVGKETLTKK